MKAIEKYYIIHPGFILDKYFSCADIAKLYGVDILECFLNLGPNSMRGIDPDDFINLHPAIDINEIKEMLQKRRELRNDLRRAD